MSSTDRLGNIHNARGEFAGKVNSRPAVSLGEAHPPAVETQWRDRIAIGLDTFDELENRIACEQAVRSIARRTLPDDASSVSFTMNHTDEGNYLIATGFHQANGLGDELTESEADAINETLFAYTGAGFTGEELPGMEPVEGYPDNFSLSLEDRIWVVRDDEVVRDEAAERHQRTATRLGLADRSRAEVDWHTMIAGAGLDDEKFSREVIDRAASAALVGATRRLVRGSARTVGLLYVQIDGGKRLRPVGYAPGNGGRPTLLDDNTVAALDAILQQYAAAGHDTRQIPGVRALPGDGDGYELVIEEAAR